MVSSNAFLNQLQDLATAKGTTVVVHYDKKNVKYLLYPVVVDGVPQTAVVSTGDCEYRELVSWDFEYWSYVKAQVIIIRTD